MSTSSSASGCSSDSNSECCETFRELLRLEKVKSPVWDYFGFPAANGQYLEKDKKKQTEVYCKLCPKKLNYLGNTTNLTSHLEYNHRLEYLKVKGKATNVPKRTISSQPSINEVFCQLEPLSTHSKRWKVLNKFVSQCIAKDLLPVSIVNIGFRTMLHTFEPR